MIKKHVTLFMGCLFFLTFLTSCDRDIIIYRYEFVQSPRIIYIANVDTELDFYGATLRGISLQVIYDELPLELGGIFTVEHSVDFATPGIYRVELITAFDNRQNLVFFVQVIDEEVFNQLSNPDHMPESEGTE